MRSEWGMCHIFLFSFIVKKKKGTTHTHTHTHEETENDDDGCNHYNSNLGRRQSVGRLFTSKKKKEKKKKKCHRYRLITGECRDASPALCVVVVVVVDSLLLCKQDANLILPIDHPLFFPSRIENYLYINNNNNKRLNS
jgi:hypothetical protein